MIKKESILALALFLAIPVVVTTGAMLFSFINPEIAAGHPNYVRNYHLLHLLKLSFLWGSFAIAALLWLVVCLLVIRSKQRSYWWLSLAALGPIGFAVIAVLNESASTQPDRYTKFVRKMKWYLRIPYELCVFAIVWEMAWELMVLKRTLRIWFEAAITGQSTAQIIAVQNASSSMWAFGESIEVIFLAVLLYLLWPLAFRLAGNRAARTHFRASTRKQS